MAERKRFVSSGEDVTDEAEQADFACPDCNGIVWEYPWWDDPSEAGGACIGTNWECEDCEWFDQS